MMHAAKPLAVVTGMLGSGKTTMIRRLLDDPTAKDTLVLVNEFGEIGLDHHLLTAITDDVMLLPNGCLCCTVRSDVIQTLCGIRRDWLAGRIASIDRIVIETSGLAEPAPLLQSLLTHPVLGDSFALAAVATVVDGQYGLGQIDRSATCRNQIRLADRLFVSKLDLGTPMSLRPLCRQLRVVNPLAWPRSAGRATLRDLFRRKGGAFPRRGIACDETNDHLSGTASVVLHTNGPVSWPAFQTWLATLMDRCGDGLLRLKGCLVFATGQPMIIQAVRTSFYPLAPAPEGVTADGKGFLVLIFSGDPPAELLRTAAAVGFERAAG